jgi:hypothetical protein
MRSTAMTTQNEKDCQAPVDLLNVPLTALQSGFDYAFGFQIKLMWSLMGINLDKKD